MRMPSVVVWSFMVGCVVVASSLTACKEDTPVAPVVVAPQPAPSPSPDASTPATSLTSEQIAAFNRGVGLMGTFSFELAYDVFDQLQASLGPEHPTYVLARRNQGIALLNQSADDAQQRAVLLFEPLLERNSKDVATHYCLGLAKLFLGEPDVAKEHFRSASEEHPNDPYVAFYMGQCLEFAGELEEARRWYERCAELDPYLRSPLLGMQRILARKGDSAKAAEYLRLFQELADNPRAKLAEFKYTRMGRLSEAGVPTSAGQLDPALAPARSGPLFVEAVLTIDGAPPWRTDAASSTLTSADLNADGRLDLFVTNAFEDGRNAVLLAVDDARYRWASDHPLTAFTMCRAALWGDIENDGDLDLYLVRDGGNLLLLRDGDAFIDRTEASGTGAAGIDCVDAAMADLDHDGDLDLYLVNGRGANELLSNNADGTFRAIGQSSGAGGDGRASVGVSLGDVDGDRDVDLFLIHAQPPHELLLNDRLWRYTPHPSPPMAATALSGALIGDWNADGLATILGVGTDGALVKASRATPATADWLEERAADAAIGASGRRDIACGSFLGEPRATLLWCESQGIATSSLAGTDLTVHAIEPPLASPGALRAWGLTVAGDTTVARGMSVVMLTPSGIRRFDPGPRQGKTALLAFSGRTQATLSMRSNTSGIGTSFAARVGTDWIGGSTFAMSTTPGQSKLPTPIGLGDATKADFVAVEWSDGVFQSELDLAASTTTAIVETQRQISSCPVIFAWDGASYQFVTDALGVGGLGYLVAPGEYAPPRPLERVLFPASIEPGLRDGAFEIRLGEPMEEACYLDAARLVGWHVPEGWSMTIDERMAIHSPEPTGDVRFYRTELRPTRVINARGEECTKAAQAPDGVAIDGNDVDPRFIGYLRSDQEITLEFDSPIDELPGEVTLVAHGWVEYPYCQTNFAAWQAGVTPRAPRLEARGADGVWHLLSEGWGYPAGMTRECSLPLGKLPAGTTALRMRTNLEIYWDALKVVGVEPCPDATREVYELVAAEVRDAGFAERIARPWKRPDYRYDRRAPLWDTRHQAGFYTAFGACEPLLQAADGALAVFGPGEEIRLRFAPAMGQTLNGHERRFILELRGWCKDYDLFTRDGEQLEPLPEPVGFTEVERQRASDLHTRFNTRYRDGR